MAAAVSSPRIAEILLAHGRVSRETLEGFLPASGSGPLLLDRLIAAGAVVAEEAARTIAEEMGLPYVTIALDQLDPALVRRVPADQLYRLRALPLIDDGRAVFVAVADPTDERALGLLAAALNRRVEPVVATTTAIRSALRDVFGPSLPTGEAMPRLDEFGDGTDGLWLAARLSDGFREGVAEFQIAPTGGGGVVWRRSDGGVQEEVERLGEVEHAALVTRLRRLVARSDESPDMQAATLRVEMDDRLLWLSVVIVPAMEGDVVCLSLQPLLDRAGALRAGLSATDADRIVAFLETGHGLLVLNGPSAARAAAVLDPFLRERGPRTRMCIAVGHPPALPIDGALHIRPGATDHDLRAATREALALHPDLLLLDASPGDVVLREALLRARGRGPSRTVLLGTWRDAADVANRLHASGIPDAELPAVLYGVVCLGPASGAARGTA